MSVREIRREAQRLMALDHLPDISPEEYAELLSMDYQAQVIEETQKRGMKLKDLAAKLGIKPAALSRRLTSANLTLKVIAEFALALGLEVEAPQLFDEEEEIEAYYEPYSAKKMFTIVNSSKSLNLQSGYSTMSQIQEDMKKQESGWTEEAGNHRSFERESIAHSEANRMGFVSVA